jgi:hypothetical protein
MTLSAERGERALSGVYEKYDIPPFTTIAAVWSAAWDIFFSAKMHSTIASLSRGDENARFIHEHHQIGFSTKDSPAPLYTPTISWLRHELFATHN